MADQAVLVGRNVEERLPVLNFEKFPLTERFDSVQGRNSLSTN
jgi:hypothetical protein